MNYRLRTGRLTLPGPARSTVLVFIDRALAFFSVAQAWFLAQPLPVQILVGAAALAVLWFLWIILRVAVVAFRDAFRGP